MPAWLIVDGGDATAEAVLGLAAYVAAGGSDAAVDSAGASWPRASPCSRGGDARQLAVRRRAAVGAVALDLARAGARRCRPPSPGRRPRLGDPDLVAPAARDSATFDPWLLTSGGPDNGRLPTRIDRSQIAYGVDSRLQSLLATAEATGSAGMRRLAGMVGGVVLRGQRVRPSRRTTRRPGGRSTASTATGTATSTRARSRRSTGCSRCSPWTPTRTWPSWPGQPACVERVGNRTVAGRGRHAGRWRARGHAGERVDRRVVLRG